ITEPVSPLLVFTPQLLEQGEIIRSREAKVHSRCYMAYLEIQHGKVTKKCGWFLVKPNLVLMDAHGKGDEITVTLGAHNINKPEWSQQKIPVRRQVPHLQYDKKTLNNVIMLHVPIFLFSLLPGSTCRVAGWDRTVIKNNMCELYPGYNRPMMLCGGSLALRNCLIRKAVFFTQKIFLGDSGDPLVCEGVVQGIASYVVNFYKPSVFTRLSKFIPWIQKILQNQH
uniref:Peptidase S1 domain-containing protein n=1 Tax=Gopherus evgoodei TaxID=1825980 RepID=A0A8C4WRC4_9SAUR